MSQHGDEHRQVRHFKRRPVFSIVFLRKQVKPNPRLAGWRIESASHGIGNGLGEPRGDRNVRGSDEFYFDNGHAD